MAKIKKRNYYVVGCGGVATYFLPSFLKTLYYSAKDKSKLTPLTLVDGDIVEEKNIARQVFGQNEVNWHKSEALADRYQDEFAELEIKYIKETALNEVFAKEMNALDPHGKEVLDKVLSYMEKKYNALAIKTAKKVFLEEDL